MSKKSMRGMPVGGDRPDPDHEMLERIRHEDKERLEDLEKKEAKRE